MNDTINQVGAGAPAAWTKTKPTAPGAYWIRGEGMLARTALVEVVNFEGELWCNLHMRNTDPEFGYGYTVAQLDEAFEWLGPLSPAAPAADGTTSDKYRAELYDEVWQRARDMGYGNVTDALVELERMKVAAPVVQDTCSTCRGSGKELHVYGPATLCRDCRPDAALVEAANAALKAVQELLGAAYHNAYLECCGKGHSGCCGSPVQAWDDRDRKIMDLLAPHENALRAALAGKGGE